MNYSQEIKSNILDTLRQNGLPFYDSYMSVFFLLYIKKIGEISAIDIKTLQLKRHIDSNDLFKLLLDRFYEMLKLHSNKLNAYRYIIRLLDKYNDREFNSCYCELIEELLTFLAINSGRYSGIFLQPMSVTKLVREIVKCINPQYIYNPFAGLCSYALISNCDYYGQEIDFHTSILARLRLDAYGKDINSLFQENSMKPWYNISADCLVSTPPFGAKIGRDKCYQINDYALHTNQYHSFRDYRSIEDFILYNFIDSSINTAVLIMPSGVCFNSSTIDVRKTILEHNALDAVIKLPSGIFYGTGISTVVIVLKKSRDSNKVTFVDGSDCIVKDSKTQDLDVDSVLELVHNDDITHKVSVDVDEIFNNDSSWDVNRYILNIEELGEGKRYILLTDVLELGTPIISNDETGIVLKPTDFSDNISVLFEDFNPEQNKITSTMKAYEGRHIVLSVLQNKIKLCVCDFEEPFYLNQNQVAFSLKENSLISLEYMAYAILNSKNIQRLALMMNGVSMRVTRQLAKQMLDCKVAIHSDVAERNNTILFAKEEYTNMRKNAMQAEMQRLGIRDASSDLSHVLGASFHKISTAIDFIQSEELSNDAKQTLNSIRDNFAYMKRMITTVGADFETQRLNLQEVEVNSFIRSYTESWNNLGYSVFELAYHSYISDSVSVKIDEDMFRVIFDTVLRNAYKHGFGAQMSSDNKVYIETSLVTYNDKEYVLLGIANNGTPFPKELTIEKYIKRGGFAGATGNTGLGGYHVYSIVKRHNGFLNISSRQAWGAIVEMLVPVEFYEETDTDKFEEYGNTETCI